MKRYLLFAATDYQATEQGWDGFQGDFNTIGDAKGAVHKLSVEYDRYHIVDTDTKGKIESGRRKRTGWVPTLILW